MALKVKGEGIKTPPATEQDKPILGLNPDEALMNAAQKVHGDPFGPSGPLLHLPRAWLRLGKWLNRTVMDPEGLMELKESIKKDGIHTPLKAVKKGNHEYHIFSGKRRYLASDGVLDVLPVIVYADITDLEVERFALVSNLHREDLPPVDLANGLSKLHQTGMTQADIALALGKTAGWVSQYINLLRLPKEAVKALETGTITFYEARELQRIDDEPDMIKSILTKEAKAFGKRVGYAPATVKDRVNRLLVKREEESQLAAKMKEITDQGGEFVKDYTGYSDSKYIEINIQGYQNQAGQLHDKHKLTCIVYAVERGRVVKLCNDPKALRKLIKKDGGDKPEDHWQREAREEKERKQREEAATGVVMAAWWSSKSPVTWEEMIAYAQHDISNLSQYWSTGPLNIMADWLGWNGKKTEGQEMVKKLVAEAEGKDLLRYWWLYKMANNSDNLPMKNWLKEHGYLEPEQPKGKKPPAPQAIDNTAILAMLDRHIVDHEDAGFDMICRTCEFTAFNVSATVARQEMEAHKDHAINVDELPPRVDHGQQPDFLTEEGIDVPLTKEEGEDLEEEAKELEKVNGDPLEYVRMPGPQEMPVRAKKDKKGK